MFRLKSFFQNFVFESVFEPETKLTFAISCLRNNFHNCQTEQSQNKKSVLRNVIIDQSNDLILTHQLMVPKMQFRTKIPFWILFPEPSLCIKVQNKAIEISGKQEPSRNTRYSPSSVSNVETIKVCWKSINLIVFPTEKVP